MTESTHERPSLAHLPVGAFAMVMGTAGLAAAWNRAAAVGPSPSWIGAALAWIALALLVALLAAYGAKAARYWSHVRAEWLHPVRSAFTATIPIGFLVTSIALVDHSPSVSRVLWWMGTATIFAITLFVMRTWIHDAQVQQVHVHPAWFIPVVGNIVVPLAGVTHAPVEISWYFFGVGLVFWLALLPIVLHRLFVAGTMPPRLTPTLAILVAPPAIASIAWVKLGGTWTDPLARVLLAVTLFQVLLLATQAPALRRVPFAISSWAYTFPLASASVAFLAIYGAEDQVFYAWAGAIVLAVSTVLVATLAVITARGFASGALLQPEG